MKFAENIYHSKDIVNIKNIEWKLKHHVGVAGLFVVTLSDKEDELLSIYHNSEFHKPHMRKRRDLFVVGISFSKLGAERISAKIISDCIKTDSSLDLKKFFESNTVSDFSDSDIEVEEADFDSDSMIINKLGQLLDDGYENLDENEGTLNKAKSSTNEDEFNGKGENE